MILKVENNVLVMYYGSNTKFAIPDGVTTIGELALSNCKALTDVFIPDSVTRIEGWAFAGCTFTHIAIPDSVKFIDDAAFDITSPDLTIKCNPSSYAWSWAESHGIETEPIMGLATSVLEKNTPVSFKTGHDNPEHML